MTIPSKLTGFLILLIGLFPATTSKVKAGAIQPTLYFTVQDVAKGRSNLETEIGKIYFADLQTRLEKHLRRYKRSDYFDESIKAIRNSPTWDPGRAPFTNSMQEKAIYFLLTGDPMTARMIRADLLRASGAYEKQGMLRPQGIHESSSALGLMMAYDAIAATGILDKKDQKHIETFFHAIGTRLYGRLIRDLREEMKLFNFVHAELAAVGSIALMFPHFEESEEWLNLAMTEYESSVLRDYYRDGGYGEGSRNYVCVSLYKLFLFTEAVRNKKGMNYWALPAFAQTFHNAGDWLLELTPPGRPGWALGDSRIDNGHRVGLYEYIANRTQDPKFRWAAETAMASGDIYPHSGSTPHALMFADMSIKPEPPTHQHKLFRNSGFIFFKQGWDKDSGLLSTRYGPTGKSGPGYPEGNSWPSHIHPDVFHLEYAWAGVDWLRDPGATSYSNPAHQLWHGATASHNTAGIGGRTPYWIIDKPDDNWSRIYKWLEPGIMEEQVQRFVYQGNRRLHLTGKTGSIGYFSAIAMTFPEVYQTRASILDYESGLLFVYDEFDSPREEPFEWYWNVKGETESIAPDTVKVTRKGDKVLFIKRLSATSHPWEQVTRNEREHIPADSTLLKWGQRAENVVAKHVFLPGESNSWTIHSDRSFTFANGTTYHLPVDGDGQNAFNMAVVAEDSERNLKHWALLRGKSLEYKGQILATSEFDGTSFIFDMEKREGLVRTPWIDDNSKDNTDYIEAQITIYLPIDKEEIKVGGKTIESSGNGRFDFALSHGSTKVSW